jgi:ribosome-associated protein
MEPATKKEKQTILTHDTNGTLGPHVLRDLVEKSLRDDKAFDIEIIPLDDQAALADYMIVATGTSSRQVIRIAEKLKDRLSARGLKNIRLEGMGQGNWVIVDAGDIIVHVFRPEVRDFYNIEKMWAMPMLGNPVAGNSRSF